MRKEDTMKDKIALVGCGALGASLAAWLTEQGREVVLCDPRTDLAPIQNSGITVRGAWRTDHPVKPCQVTNDPAALEGIERVLVCVCADYQTQAAAFLAPVISTQAAVLLIPGNLGAVQVKQVFAQAGKPDVAVAEMSDACWPCRKKGETEFTVALPLKEKTVAAYPRRDTPRILAAFSGYLPMAEADHILAASLSSPNILAHIPGTVMNAMLIQQKGTDFALFRDGLSDRLIDCIELIEGERNAIFNRLGIPVPGAPTRLFLQKLLDGAESPAMRPFIELDGPSDFRHRYVEEDAPCGAAMLCSLGKLTGVDTPVLSAFLTIISALNGRDYYAAGRTLENLGLPSTSPQDLMDAL